MNTLKTTIMTACAVSALAVCAGTRAIDLASEADRRAQPRFEQISHAVGVTDGEWADGRWCYRFRVTKAWTGELPQWPSVNLKPSVTDWSGYDRLVLDVFNDAIGGDVMGLFLSEPTGRLQNGLCPRGLPLGDYGYHRWVVELKNWPKETDPHRIGRLHIFFTTPTSADIHVSGFHLLRPGEPLPPVSERFMKEKVAPAKLRAEAYRREIRAEAVKGFVADCRRTGQTGANAWIGKATSMSKVRPRAEADGARGADAFSLRLARGEYESFQVLVMPNGRDLEDVTVRVSDLVRTGTGSVDSIAGTLFKCSPVGYVKTVNAPPYRGGVNVVTNLPGGYFRKTKPLGTGWWPDPILDWTDRADVRGEDLQSFWIRFRCPDGQQAGVYRGTVRVEGRGWAETFPISVRVYGFGVPKKSPLPLAITFGPGPSVQFADEEQRALVKSLKADPLAPVNQWKKHLLEWGDFLADHYITMDSLYHDGRAVKWDVLERLREQGRLGFFNLGYWDYPRDMSEKGKANWRKTFFGRIRPPYEKAKKLGLLDHAYLYGCDEVHTQYFGNIRWALAELKREFPEVPRFTTAYDHKYGVGSALGDMDWFCPTTYMYAPTAVTNIPASRAAGHQVWWYIACGPHAPWANMFVEYQAIEGRQLMGAQTVKYRPQGFLYYQISIWNARRPITGGNTFTDWEPRSWTRYHGDGSWFCCGPDGTPCATIRMENFRDGLEDYAYALEYERRTGRRCEVPPEVCRDVDQFTDDPDVYYAWRDRIAEAIESAGAADR